MIWSFILSRIYTCLNCSYLPWLRIVCTGPLSSMPWRLIFLSFANSFALAARTTINSSLIFFSSSVKSPTTSAIEEMRICCFSLFFKRYLSNIVQNANIFLLKFPANRPLPRNISFPTVPISVYWDFTRSSGTRILKITRITSSLNISNVSKS